MKIKDYDSGFVLNEKEKERLIGMSGILKGVLDVIPIYFVKSQTIDKYGSIHWVIKREIFNNAMKKNSNSNLIELAQYFEEELNRGIECTEYTTNSLVGIFLSERDEICKGPHILVCPDKIKEISNMYFEDILMKVILHELSHAFFYMGKKSLSGGLDPLSQELNNFFNTLIGKETTINHKPNLEEHIVEESLCEAYAFSRFEDFSNIIDFMTNENRPPEYTSFPFWTKQINDGSLSFLMLDWRRGNLRRFSVLALEPFVNVFDINLTKFQYSIKKIASYILTFQ
ncbi:hypothetical protein ACNF40_08675 [Cuniculiplasma sp. SKW4]|uniref:hypothetical protein n=1 Tax=Cuniculiplasma sp. SKW4 TaxID=3400171 RepID=UPI003FD10A6D